MSIVCLSERECLEWMHGYWPPEPLGGAAWGEYLDLTRDSPLAQQAQELWDYMAYFWLRLNEHYPDTPYWNWLCAGSIPLPWWVAERSKVTLVTAVQYEPRRMRWLKQ